MEYPSIIENLQELQGRKLRGWRVDVALPGNAPASFTLIFDGGKALEVSHEVPDGQDPSCFFTLGFHEDRGRGPVPKLHEEG